MSQRRRAGGSDVTRPLIVHVLDRFALGGMETVALSVMQSTQDNYRHHIVCLRDPGTLAGHAEALGVPVDAVGKKPGKDVLAYWRLSRRLRQLAPDIVHSYNIGALDAALWARLAGAKRVVHAEHGRDVSDPHGKNRKYQWMRRCLAPFIDRFVPVSEDLADWLAHQVGLPVDKITTIHNGIDTERFRPTTTDEHDTADEVPWPDGFARADSTVIGSVGRLDAVKAFDNLVESFAQLCNQFPDKSLRLVIVGDGPERAALEQQISSAGLKDRVWLPGSREDVDSILQAMDIYVCSSVAEGIALTILEAMACALPVVATQVGGNPELVIAEKTGKLVVPMQPAMLAEAVAEYIQAPEAAVSAGRNGRERVCEEFSLDTMMIRYCELYDHLLALNHAYSSVSARSE